MAYNGSGTFTLYSPGNPVVTGTTISSTWANNTLTDIATGLSTALTKDGQTTPTANIPMGGFRLTGLAAATALTDAIRYDQVQNSSPTYLTSPAGTDTITATAPNSLAAYAAGQVFRFIPANTNTGAATININSIGAKAITKNGATALAAGDLVATKFAEIVYDGTQFQLANPSQAQIPSAVGRNFAGRTNSSNPNYQVDFTASELSVKTSANASLTLYTVSVTADITASGANGLDTGSEAGDTWYYLYVIYNPSTATVASLLSASATSPTLPSGYTYFALVGAVRNDGSSNFIKYQQNGMAVTFESPQAVLSGGAATTETAITVTSFVPDIAQSFKVSSTASMTADGSGAALAALILRWVSGTNYFVNQGALYGLANGSSGNFIFTGTQTDIPNRSRDFYYLWSGVTGSSQAANVSILGFTIPGGGQ